MIRKLDETRNGNSIYAQMCTTVTVRILLLLTCVCVECLIGKQKKTTLFKVTEPSSVHCAHPAVTYMRGGVIQSNGSGEEEAVQVTRDFIFDDDHHTGHHLSLST